MAAPIAVPKLQALQEAITTFLLDPKHHDLLAILKGLRNGLVYGTKVRFPHALVMVFLFRSGSFRSKARAVLAATRTHATNLGLYVTLYKTTLLALRRLNGGKERSADSFLAGLLGGYVVFGRGGSSSSNNVNMQIVVYVFARVVLALAKLAVSDGPLGVVRAPAARERVARVAWPLFAGGSWAAVMWLFRWYPEALQGSLRGSMVYLYTNADTWTGIRDFALHNK